jgi:HK97 family phage portal protein
MKDITLKTAQARQKAIQEKSLPSVLWESMIVGGGSYQASRWDKHNIIEQAYQRNAPFHAGCNLIANMIADMAIEVEVNIKGKKSRTDDHPLLRAMSRNEPIREYIKRKVLYYIVTGETFSDIVMSSDRKRPIGFIVMPSQFCKKIEGNRFNPIKEVQYLEKGKEFTKNYREVIHIYNPSLSNYFEEISPAVPLQELIALNNACITWNKNVAQAGGLPPVVAKARGINKQRAQELQEDWRMQSGSKNSHLLKVMGENLEFEKLNDNPHDAEWNQAVMSSMRMIFMVLGVSSSLMNDASNKTYNNYHEARKSLYTEGCIPIAEQVLGAITRKVQSFYDDNPVLVIAKEKIEAIQEERKAMIDRLVKAVDAGIMTANEARKELGLAKGHGATADVLQNARIINNIPKVDINENQQEDNDPQNPIDDDENES